MPRLFLLAAVCATIVCAMAIDAMANQGVLFTGSGFNGTRSNLKGSATIPSTGGAIATVRFQSGLTGTPGLFQVGEISEGSSFSSDCGTATIGLLVEWGNVNGTLACDAFFAAFGSDHRFAAIRQSGTSGTWNAYEDGSIIDTKNLNWGSGNAFAAAEYNGTAPSSYSFTWGPSGEIAWQVSTNSGSSYTTVTSATKSNDGGWTIGSPPSPFTISR